MNEPESQSQSQKERTVRLPKSILTNAAHELIAAADKLAEEAERALDLPEPAGQGLQEALEAYRAVRP